jgi:hypothetical protein
VDGADFCCPPTRKTPVRQTGVSCPATWSMRRPLSLRRSDELGDRSSERTLWRTPAIRLGRLLGAKQLTSSWHPSRRPDVKTGQNAMQ